MKALLNISIEVDHCNGTKGRAAEVDDILTELLNSVSKTIPRRRLKLRESEVESTEDGEFRCPRF